MLLPNAAAVRGNADRTRSYLQSDGGGRGHERQGGRDGRRGGRALDRRGGHGAGHGGRRVDALGADGGRAGHDLGRVGVLARDLLELEVGRGAVLDLWVVLKWGAGGAKREEGG